jgi:hypothetical protein
MINMLFNLAITVAILASLSACDSMRSAAYAGGGAVAGGALAGGIGYAASKGNIQTTAISAAGGAVGGAVLGGLFAGHQKAKKDKAKEEGYQLGESDAVKRQYWIARNLQKGKSNDEENPYHTRYYTFNIQPDPQASINHVPYNVTLPVLE